MTALGSARAALAVFTLGVGLMLVFDGTLTRIAGVALLLGGMVLGVFAIATDEFVAGDEDHVAEPAFGSAQRSPKARP